jgi:acetyl esterase/lipase
MYKCHATDFEKQSKALDDVLYPALMSEVVLKKYPPIAVFTSEFDFFRRDNTVFAAKAKKCGKLIDLQIMPGVTHGYTG